MRQPPDFTPALGRSELTGDYDRVIAVMTRERRWRMALLTMVSPQPGQTILDIGCGTGTFAIMLKAAEPQCEVIAIDPDPEVLRIAQAKAHEQDVAIDWREGFGDQADEIAGSDLADVVVSSLVLHQCPVSMKRDILGASSRALKPGGRLLIADYGLQRTLLMRLLFRQVQMLDGFENTGPNAKGIVAQLIAEAGFVDVAEARVIPTPTGSISIYSAQRPPS